jgi:hypothetical protein
MDGFSSAAGRIFSNFLMLILAIADVISYNFRILQEWLSCLRMWGGVP